ncbi:hypothetical protein EZY14_004185 [Kordia sp. TARA_039_SRF]|nr:hypothetical protein EZY14_004185 [Kordia sp. TARA_039_SRF]
MKTKLNLEILADNNCSGGYCPTVYKTENGRYFVQGYKLTDEVSIDIPDGEQLVEIDENLLNNLRDKLR